MLVVKMMILDVDGENDDVVGIESSVQNITIMATSNAMKEPDILWGFNEGKIQNLVGDDDDHDCDDDDDDNDNNDGFDDYDDDDNNVCDHDECNDNNVCNDHMDGESPVLSRTKGKHLQLGQFIILVLPLHICISTSSSRR